MYTSNYLTGVDPSQQQGMSGVTEGYDSTPVYAPSSGPVGSGAAQAPTSTGASAPGTLQASGNGAFAPTTDYSQLPDWLRANQRFQPTGAGGGAAEGAQYGAVGQYNKFVNQYGEDTVKNPWFTSAAAQSDPRFMGMNLDPFGHPNTGYGFQDGMFYGQNNNTDLFKGPSAGVDVGNINNITDHSGSGTIGDYLEKIYGQVHAGTPQMTFDQFRSMYYNQTAGGGPGDATYPYWEGNGQQYGQPYQAPTQQQPTTVPNITGNPIMRGTGAPYTATPQPTY